MITYFCNMLITLWYTLFILWLVFSINWLKKNIAFKHNILKKTPKIWEWNIFEKMRLTLNWNVKNFYNFRKVLLVFRKKFTHRIFIVLFIYFLETEMRHFISLKDFLIISYIKWYLIKNTNQVILLRFWFSF